MRVLLLFLLTRRVELLQEKTGVKSIQVDVSSPCWLQTCKATEVLQRGWSCVCLCVGERESGTDWHSVGPEGIWISDQPLPPSPSEPVRPGMLLLRASHPSTPSLLPSPPPFISPRLLKATLFENTIAVVCFFFSFCLPSSFFPPPLAFSPFPPSVFLFTRSHLSNPTPLRQPPLLSTTWGTGRLPKHRLVNCAGLSVGKQACASSCKTETCWQASVTHVIQAADHKLIVQYAGWGRF